MNKQILSMAMILMIFMTISCQKDKEIVPVTQNVTVGFTINMETQDEGMKSSATLDWKHPIDAIRIQLTNESTEEVYTEEFTNIDNLVMVVPSGKYLATVTTIDQSNFSQYFQFSSERNINASYSTSVTMDAIMVQSLITVSCDMTPSIGENTLFEREGIYYAYLKDWNGKWLYGEKEVLTSEYPSPGKIYHFTLRTDGSIEEGIEDWNNDYASILDQLVQKELFDESEPTGFLVTKDAQAGSVWKKNRNDQEASYDITPIIAHVLYLAGYSEVSKLGYEANYYHLSQGLELTGGSLYGLMGGYESTGNEKYKTLAAELLPLISKKFSPNGAQPARSEFWGYDYINFLEGARRAAKYGIPGGEEYFETLKADYLANYEQVAQDDLQRLYINAIFDRLEIGVHQGIVSWDHKYNLQDAAVGIMGDSWETPTNIKRHMINNLLRNAHRAEDLAEAVYALSL